MNSSVSILLFGIARDLVGQPSVSVPVSEGITVNELLTQINQDYPALLGIRSVLVAINGEYADLNQVVVSQDEIALIPPVSGG